MMFRHAEVEQAAQQLDALMESGDPTPEECDRMEIFCKRWLMKIKDCREIEIDIRIADLVGVCEEARSAIIGQLQMHESLDCPGVRLPHMAEQRLTRLAKKLKQAAKG
jgi:hypothetical protein